MEYVAYILSHNGLTGRLEQFKKDIEAIIIYIYSMLLPDVSRNIYFLLVHWYTTQYTIAQRRTKEDKWISHTQKGLFIYII